jgi:hypothetical protein
MDTPEFPQTPPTPQPELTDVQEQFASLYHLAVSMLLLLLVVSGTLGIYLWHQYKYTKREVDAVKNYVAQYQKSRSPQSDMLIKKLADYGKTNADFKPILDKYGIKQMAPTGTTPLAPTNALKK